MGRNNIGNVWHNKRVYGFIFANLGKFSKTHRLSGNNAFYHKSPFIKKKWTKPNFWTQQWQVQRSGGVEGRWRGRGGGEIRDGASAHVKLPLQMRTGPPFCFLQVQIDMQI